MVIKPLTHKQMSKCKVTHAALKGIMSDGLWDYNINKRDCTRHFYEGTGAYLLVLCPLMLKC